MKKKATATITLAVEAVFDDDGENDLEDQAITVLDAKAEAEYGLMSFQYQLEDIEVTDVP